MSSMASAGQSHEKKGSDAIDTLPNDLARIITHVHPVLLLSVYIAGFSSLVQDPVSGLLAGLIPCILIQSAYCLICIPAAGAVTRKPQKSKPGGKKARDEPAFNIFPVIFSLLLTVAIAPVLLLLQILFGAPFTTHLPHTLLSSLHISFLAFFPLFYVYGLDTTMWLEICSAKAPFDQVFGGTVGAVVGAWLGAVPIPLDWDRPWQAWPITVLTGAYLGYVLGKLWGNWDRIKGWRMGVA